MEGYLGETDVSDQFNYPPEKVAMIFLEKYGGIDGAHHKDWVLDQIARALKGAPLIAKEARWENGQMETRFTLGDPPKEYWAWVDEMKEGEDGPDTYGYDFGIAP